MPTKTWKGNGTSNLWSLDACWLEGAKPVKGDDILFNNTTTNDCHADVAGGDMTRLSTFTMNGYTGKLFLGNFLGFMKANGASSMTSGTITVEDAYTLNFPAQIRFGNTHAFTWSGGTIASNYQGVAPIVTIGDGMTVSTATISSGAVLKGGRLINVKSIMTITGMTFDNRDYDPNQIVAPPNDRTPGPCELTNMQGGHIVLPDGALLVPATSATQKYTKGLVNNADTNSAIVLGTNVTATINVQLLNSGEIYLGNNATLINQPTIRPEPTPFPSGYPEPVHVTRSSGNVISPGAGVVAAAMRIRLAGSENNPEPQPATDNSQYANTVEGAISAAMQEMLQMSIEGPILLGGVGAMGNPAAGKVVLSPGGTNGGYGTMTFTHNVTHKSGVILISVEVDSNTGKLTGRNSFIDVKGWFLLVNKVPMNPPGLQIGWRKLGNGPYAVPVGKAQSAKIINWGVVIGPAFTNRTFGNTFGGGYKVIYNPTSIWIETFDT